MIKFNDSPLVLKKLIFLSRYSSIVTVTKTSLTTKNMQIIFPDEYDIILLNSEVSEFSIKINDLLYILGKTDECLVTKNHFIIKYQVSEINVEKKFKRYGEIFILPCSDPKLSIKVGKLIVLSEDDILIKCTDQGLFKMSSAVIIETRLVHKNCSVINSKVDEVSVKVKSKDLRVLETFQNDKIFCMFDNYILVYVLEDKITNIIMLQILQK
ncbi:hypothetical protein P3W45_000596 [Vairimorpha bombi]|jgi:hypothetical protein